MPESPKASTIAWWLVLLTLYLTCAWGLTVLVANFLPFAFLVLFLLFIAWAYDRDVKRDFKISPNTDNENVLVRYGRPIYRNTLVVALPAGTNRVEAHEISGKLTRYLMTKLERIFRAQHYLEGQMHLEAPETFTLPMQFANSGSKTTIRNVSAMVLKTESGIRLGNFIHCEALESRLTIHFSSRASVAFYWHDLISFIVLSPLTLLFWISPWLASRYSIAADLGSRVRHPANKLDLDALLSAFCSETLESTQDFLETHDLMTREAAQSIVSAKAHFSLRASELAYTSAFGSLGDWLVHLGMNPNPAIISDRHPAPQ